MAVSKFKPASDILAVYENVGQVHFGENYVCMKVEDIQRWLHLDLRYQWHHAEQLWHVYDIDLLIC